ncbi:MAG: hypothetical protein WKG07_30865 [Hymenobacter sp.]
MSFLDLERGHAHGPRLPCPPALGEAYSQLAGLLSPAELRAFNLTYAARNAGTAFQRPGVARPSSRA